MTGERHRGLPFPPRPLPCTPPTHLGQRVNGDGGSKVAAADGLQQGHRRLDEDVGVRRAGVHHGLACHASRQHGNCQRSQTRTHGGRGRPGGREGPTDRAGSPHNSNTAVSLLMKLVLPLLLLAVATAAPLTLQCDIVVLGGSTAALAAALSAAAAAPAAHVCLTEPT